MLSLLREGLDNLEILVVDDGSTDGALATISDLRVTVLKLGANRGVAAARNAGIEVARGRYLTFLDADDLLFPGGILWRLEWLERHPEARALAGRPAGIIDAKGEPIPELKHVLHPEYQPPKLLTLDYFRKGNAYPVAMWNFLFRRDLIEEVGRFDERMEIAEDFDYLLRVLERTDIPVEFQPIVLRRLHDSNVSVTTEDGAPHLKPETIAYAQAVLDRLGVSPDQWNLWETGYTS